MGRRDCGGFFFVTAVCRLSGRVASGPSYYCVSRSFPHCLRVELGWRCSAVCVLRPMALLLEVAGRSDVGCVRENNEDNFGYDTRHGIFVVCDGMGGQAAGEVASKVARRHGAALFPRPGGAQNRRTAGRTPATTRRLGRNRWEPAIIARQSGHSRSCQKNASRIPGWVRPSPRSSWKAIFLVSATLAIRASTWCATARSSNSPTIIPLLRSMSAAAC